MPGPFDYPLPPQAQYGRAGMKQPRFMGPPVPSGGGIQPYRAPGFDGGPVDPYAVSHGQPGVSPPIMPPVPYGQKPPPVFDGGPVVGGKPGPGYDGGPVVGGVGKPPPSFGGGPSIKPGPTPTGQWVDAGYGYGPLNAQGMQWSEPAGQTTPKMGPRPLGQAGLYGVGR